MDVGFSSSSDLDQENVNTNTFITSFGTIHYVDTMTDNVMTKVAMPCSSRAYKHKYSKYEDIRLGGIEYRLIAD